MKNISSHVHSFFLIKSLFILLNGVNTSQVLNPLWDVLERFPVAMIKNVTASKVEEIVQSDDVLTMCKHHHLQKLHQLKVGWLNHVNPRILNYATIISHISGYFSDNTRSIDGDVLMDIMKLSDLICMRFFEISPQEKLIVSISYTVIII